MKTPLELRTHILTQIGSSGANLLGTRTYAATATKYAFTATGDVITATGITFTNGDALKLFGANLPAPLLQDTIYYAVESSGATCKLSLTLGGAAIALTTAGSGIRQVQKQVIQPSISILPDPQYEDSGMAAPSIINGSPVAYQGIEAVIYSGYEGNEYTALLAGEAELNSEISILLKDWNSDTNDTIAKAAHFVAKGLDIVRTITNPNPDQAPLLRSIILVVRYAGYL